MSKLVVCIMGQDCQKFIGMCLDSVKDADALVYCDGGSTDETLNIVGEAIRGREGDIIENEYDQEDKKMNGKQRNFYLDYLKENYPNDWCLCLDADEIVEDLSKIKDFINKEVVKKGLYSVKMRHLIGDLSHEDSTVPEHFVLNRLFKISEADKYPEVEHPVLQGLQMGTTSCTTIWHLAYIPNMGDIKKRYDSHMKKSNMHSPEFLKWWYHAHLFGTYPKTQFNPSELPKQLLDEFNINKDELYFENRNLELKHFIDAIHWRDFFKPKHAMEFGCGKGPRVLAMNQIGLPSRGIELSQYAVDNKLHPLVEQGDILNYSGEKQFDLTIAYDLFEHIPYEEINKAIETFINASNIHILVSVPVIGDPNLENDPTHIIKETKEWWIKQFTQKGCKQINVPEHFLYKEQLLIFKVKNATI